MRGALPGLSSRRGRGSRVTRRRPITGDGSRNSTAVAGDGGGDVDGTCPGAAHIAIEGPRVTEEHGRRRKLGMVVRQPGCLAAVGGGRLLRLRRTTPHSRTTSMTVNNDGVAGPWLVCHREPSSLRGLLWGAMELHGRRWRRCLPGSNQLRRGETLLSATTDYTLTLLVSGDGNFPA